MESPFARVLVPLDGSAAGDRAVGPAVALARKAGVPLTLLSQEVRGANEGKAEHLAELAAAHEHDVDVSTEVIDRESAVLAITDACRPGTLVCMASRGRGRSQNLLGSVAQSVLRTVDQPVLMVGPEAGGDGFLESGRVVVPLDGSPTARTAIDPARGWSQLLGLPLWLVTVTSGGTALDDDALEGGGLAALAEQRGDVAGWDVLHDDDPAAALARLADDDVALLVMTTHGRTGWDRLRLGSVVSTTIRRAPVPVLVIPSSAAEEASAPH